MKANDSSQTFEATIHLAEKRGHSIDDNCQTQHTFNDGRFSREDRRPFGNLTRLNDHHLRGAGEATIVLNDRELTMLLPVIGGLVFTVGGEELKFLEVGTAAWISMPSQTVLTIKNPHDREEINFLLISFQNDHVNQKAIEEWAFDLDAHKNGMINFCPVQAAHLTCSIGAFEGRKEAIINLDTHGFMYGFVIQGAFEVEDRLLQPRDGLALKHCQNVAFESLSQNAVVIFFAWQ